MDFFFENQFSFEDDRLSEINKVLHEVQLKLLVSPFLTIRMINSAGVSRLKFFSDFARFLQFLEDTILLIRQQVMFTNMSRL